MAIQTEILWLPGDRLRVVHGRAVQAGEAGGERFVARLERGGNHGRVKW